MTTTLANSGLSARGPEDLPRYVRRLQALIFGPYKSGKTITAHGMPRTRTIDFDDGMQSVEWAILSGLIHKELNEIAYETMIPKNERDTQFLNKALKQIDEWIDEEDIPPEKWDKPYPQFWDTLVIDSMSGFNRGAIILALAENANLNLSKSWGSWKKGGLHVRPGRIQDFGAASQLTDQFVQQIRTLPKNIIVLAHEHTVMNEEGGVISIQPLLWGQARMNVPSQFDEVWYAHTAGSRKAPEFRLQTTPDPTRKCGSRLGCLPPLMETDFEAAKKIVADFYKVDPDWLWSSGHGREAADKEAKELLEEEVSRI